MKYNPARKLIGTALIILIFSFAEAQADATPSKEEAFSPPRLESTPGLQEKVISDNHSVNWKEFSLKICLELNYEALRAYKSEDLRDYTTISPPINPQQSMRLVKYIKKQAGDFYTENLPIDSELSPPPYNAIFARCINFYHSRELSDFLFNLENNK
jgi:hypothetical protein